MVNVKMTPQRIEQFKRLYEEGKTLKEIASMLGVSSNVLSYWREKLNLPARRRKSKVDLELFKEMYLSGEPIEKIAERLKISVPYVHFIAMRLGLKRKRSFVDKVIPTINEVVSERGILTYKELCNLIGIVSKGVVKKALREMQSKGEVNVIKLRLGRKGGILSPSYKLVDGLVSMKHSRNIYIFKDWVKFYEFLSRHVSIDLLKNKKYKRSFTGRLRRSGVPIERIYEFYKYIGI